MSDSNDIMADLAAAWGEMDDVELDESESESEAVEPESAAEPADTGDDTEVAEAAPEPEDTAPVEPVDDLPPKGLSAAAREVWKDVPQAVKEQIVKREKDYEAGIVKYAEQAKRADMMDRALAPFQQYFSMNGGPGKVLPDLLQTGALLQMGAPQQKAQAVANIIKQFGVDIATLDSLLVGEQPKNQLPPEIEQELTQMRQFIGNYQQQQAYAQQQTQQRVVSEVEQFQNDPKNEFYNDVKMDMADLMDVAAKQGRAMTLQEAYERACMMNPSISQIINSRRSAEQVAQKRKAASSVAGSPGGPGDNSPPSSLRDTIAQAWDNAGVV